MPYLTPEYRKKLEDAGYTNQQIGDFEALKSVHNPNYDNSLKPKTPTKRVPQSNLNQSAKVFSTVFPGKQIGESIGTLGGYAYNKIRDKIKGTDVSKYYDLKAPTPAQAIGDAAQVALMVGTGGASSALKGATTIAGKALKLGANILKGGALGYGLDVTQKLKEGETKPSNILKPGLGTVLGGAIPGVLPAVGAAKNMAGRALSEISGSLTGQGFGGQKSLLNVIEKGGNAAKIAKKAMRGGYSIDQIKQEADEGLNTIISGRSSRYQKNLETLSTNKKSFDITPIGETLKNELESFKVKLKSNGELDFSQSPLRFNKTAQNDISTIFSEMKNFGKNQGDRTVVGLDSLKRAFSDLYTESGEARKFVSNMTKSVRKVLSDIPGYNQMSDDYSKSTQLIKEIKKELSVGDRKSMDAAFSKFSKVLRNNNEMKQQLLSELDNASGGKLIPMISGELSRPFLARGLTRPFSGLLAGGAGISGAAFSGILKALIIGGLSTSPRLAGEIINILGISRKFTKPVAQALNSMLLQFGANKSINENR